VYGMALSAWIGSALGWWQFRKAWLESGRGTAVSAHQQTRRGGRHRKARTMRSQALS
jgi:hypothetical protein